MRRLRSPGTRRRPRRSVSTKPTRDPGSRQAGRLRGARSRPAGVRSHDHPGHRCAHDRRRRRRRVRSLTMSGPFRAGASRSPRCRVLRSVSPLWSHVTSCAPAWRRDRARRPLRPRRRVPRCGRADSWELAHPRRGERWAAALLGTVLYATQASLFFAAVERGSAGLATVLFYTYPAMVIGAEAMLTRKMPQRTFLYAVILAAAGTVLVAVSGSEISFSAAVFAFALAAAALFCVYLVVSARYLAHTDRFVASCWVTGGALCRYRGAGRGWRWAGDPGCSLARARRRRPRDRLRVRRAARGAATYRPRAHRRGAQHRDRRRGRLRSADPRRRRSAPSRCSARWRSSSRPRG